MRQMLQFYANGKLQLAEVPAPEVTSGRVLVQTRASLVSVGTEKYMLELARKSLIGKALARPDLVKQVVVKARTDGILEAWRQAMGRLDTPLPLGYSSAGVVINVGPGVEGFTVGDPVACTGSSYAGHVEVAAVPAALCVKMPPSVDFESAAFAALGGIALETVRMARVTLGERVVVIGLGLLGQIAIQLLRAGGCHVIGMDINPKKAEIALHAGAEAVATSDVELSAVCRQIYDNQGADAVIILAATSSNAPLEQAAELCRERGRIVAAGLVGLEIPRKPFYDKELELVVSRAWGPGLYDLNYTEKNLDYPIAYARWTARRNLEEFLAQLGKNVIRVDHLITHRFSIDQAVQAYEMLLANKEPYLGVLLQYPETTDLCRRVDLKSPPTVALSSRRQGGFDAIGVGVIGAGLFARGTLLPIFRKAKNIELRGVATSGGISGKHTAEKFGFQYSTTNAEEILADPNIELVFILTRHGLHSTLVVDAIKAGKHVFVEKPLGISWEQLRNVVGVYQAVDSRSCIQEGTCEANTDHLPKSFHPQQLMVGFNRRFSPFSRWLKVGLADITEPLVVHCTVNAGRVPPDSWVYDSEQGGGRIIGEVCHFVDLVQYLTGSTPIRVYAESLSDGGYRQSDNVATTLKMANGSVCSITYASGGDKAAPRERVEVFGGGAVGVIENFRAATLIRGGRKQRINRWLSADRGHRSEIEMLLDAIRNGGQAPVPFVEYVYTTIASLAIEESLRAGLPVVVDLNSLAVERPTGSEEMEDIGVESDPRGPLE